MVKKKWQNLGKENIFKNQYITLDTWKMRIPNGARRDYYIHKTFDFVVVGVLTEDKKMLFLRQYYISQDKYLPALVAGIVDAGERPIQTARRELREESGYEARKIVSLGSVIKGKYTTGHSYFFLALDARRVGEPKLEESEDLVVKTVSYRIFKKMTLTKKFPEVYMELCARRIVEYLEKKI